MERKHIINTGLYSDYAVNLFENLRVASRSIGRRGSVNRELYIILKGPDDCIDLYMPQKYGFQHIANGEVCLVDVETWPGRYYHYSFGNNNKKTLELFALQLKTIVKNDINDESDWYRYNFDTEVQVGNDKYPVAELYFVFDFLWNHIKSVNAFKKACPDIANKIIGSPRDPIITEFIETSNKKKRELYCEYVKRIDDLAVNEVKGYTSTVANRELAKKIKELYESFVAECEQRKIALKEQLQKDLAECEIPKEMLVSNSISI